VARRTRAQRFLRAYAAIETGLRALVAADRHLRFYDLVDRAASKSPAVAAHLNALKEYADLRNAIAHGDPIRPLADPYESTVRGIEGIAEVILAPPLLIEALKVPEVETCRGDTPLLDAALAMKRGDFSQLPLVEAPTITALLTAETVMRFVAHQAKSLHSLATATVRDALPHAERQDNYMVVSGSATVFDAIGAFERASRAGTSLDAIVVVDPAATSPVLSIVTTFDMPVLLAAARR
jgi:CBS domain-containing protein